MRNARYELAISQYDAWIGEHAHDEQLWTGLNGRCWARAMLGKELDKALDDCNAALRRGPRNSEVLDSRGLVHLRLGQYREAIEDYDAALRLQPRLAWSLYGRGLAKQKLGDAAGGAADIAAAVAIAPTLPAQAKRIGLVDAAPEPATYSGPAPATPAAAPAPAKPQ
jgi:tetratricopeptide (TPR) repeat protein